MNIYVGNLPYTISEDDLRQAFEAHGPVTAVKIIIDRMTNKSKGFGFVEMQDEDAANNAIEALNGAELKGRNIVVNKSHSKPENGNSRGGGGSRPQSGRPNRSGGFGGRGRF